MSASNGDGNVFGDAPSKAQGCNPLEELRPSTLPKVPAHCLPWTSHLHKKKVLKAGVSQQNWLLLRNSTQDEHGCLVHSVPQGSRWDIHKVPGYQIEELPGEGAGWLLNTPYPPIAPTHLGQMPKSSPWPKAPHNLPRHTPLWPHPPYSPPGSLFPRYMGLLVLRLPEHSHSEPLYWLFPLYTMFFP